MPVVLASRCMTGPVVTGTSGYPGGEIDPIARGLVPAGLLSGLKARLLLPLGQGGREAAEALFAPCQ